MTAILTYHHIGDPPKNSDSRNLFVSVENFRNQMSFLADAGFQVVALDRLRAALEGEEPLSPRSAAITFDDGYEDNFQNSFPILKERGFTATFFITTGRIGKTDGQGQTYMSEGQLREMDSAGMTLGSHTVSHPWLARIPPDDARRELTESKSALEQILGKPVRWLAYPSGSFNRPIAQMAGGLGYTGACSVIRDNRPTARQLYWLPRVMVMSDTTPLRFRYYFSSLYHWIHERKNRKRWPDLP